jgi:hypothetical protein
MLHLLKRHPFAMDAFFRRTLVLTYAFPAAALEPLLAPGLTLDTEGGYGFLAIAMVQTEGLRPAGLPVWAGTSFFLSGYRIFTRLARGGGSLRGLQILRSYADRRSMAVSANLFTHYNYRVCRARISERQGEIEYSLRTADGSADLDVVARPWSSDNACPPFGAPFADAKSARRFAGPLPYTFSYEPETHSMIRVRGVREHWDPQPVTAQVARNTFLDWGPLRGGGGALAAAFTVERVDYRWQRGVRQELEVE